MADLYINQAEADDLLAYLAVDYSRIIGNILLFNHRQIINISEFILFFYRQALLKNQNKYSKFNKSKSFSYQGHKVNYRIQQKKLMYLMLTYAFIAEE